MSVVVPAYNEEERMGGMLEEAVEFLQAEYGVPPGAEAQLKAQAYQPGKGGSKKANGSAGGRKRELRGWEIIIVSDGSRDRTVDVALKFARDHQIESNQAAIRGPWSPLKDKHATYIPQGAIRVVALEENRGKGGAVTHGLRHARGQYVVFADADGATKFDDLEHLVKAARKAADSRGRAMAIGSRAHLVGSEATVKVRLSFCHTQPRLSNHSLQTALGDAQPAHACLPPLHPDPDAAGDEPDRGHAVRLQALHARGAAGHCAVHAHGGLDLRRGDADAERERGHPHGRGARRLEGGAREQAERHQR